MTFGRRVDGIGGNRRAEREPLKLEAVVETLSVRGSASIVDVSQSGARVRCEFLPDEGDEIFLRVGEVTIFAAVVWRDPQNGECGIAFDESLDRSTLVALRMESLKFVQSDLSPEEFRAIEDWRTGKAR